MKISRWPTIRKHGLLTKEFLIFNLFNWLLLNWHGLNPFHYVFTFKKVGNNNNNNVDKECLFPVNTLSFYANV